MVVTIVVFETLSGKSCRFAGVTLVSLALDDVVTVVVVVVVTMAAFPEDFLTTAALEVVLATPSMTPCADGTRPGEVFFR